MDNATDSVQITYPLTIQKADGSTVSWSPKQVITKSKSGRRARPARAARSKATVSSTAFEHQHGPTRSLSA
jgi:hypothetical protein